jgi:TatD DNase family protein
MAASASRLTASQTGTYVWRIRLAPAGACYTDAVDLVKRGLDEVAAILSVNRPLPPFDAHAHVDVDVHPRSLLSLRAVVLVALRSQDEFDRVAGRDDALAVWGVGIHPGVEAAVHGFDPGRLRTQLNETPLLSEIGLDRRSPVPAADQEAVFRTALDAHDDAACIASVHSAGRTGRLIAAARGRQPTGPTLTT